MTTIHCVICGREQEAYLEAGHIECINQYRLVVRCNWVCKVCGLPEQSPSFPRIYYSNDDKEMFP